MWDNNVSIAGNVVREPEIKYTQGGTALAKFSVAVNEKKGDEERTHYFDVTTFGRCAENVGNSVSKGDRVSVQGKLEQQTWETDGGDKRSKVAIVADDVAVSLKWKGATVSGDSGGDGGSRQSSSQGYTPGSEPF